MASTQEVRRYLAYWFQLGKHVIISDGQERLLPQPVIEGDRYSQAFEDCWRRITAPDVGDCYLEATEELVADLLQPEWDVSPCVRCSMPVPVRHVGMPPLSCPCSDLLSWPNLDVPLPRSPVNSQVKLRDIQRRLMAMRDRT
jgi:hypothetical protein